MRYGVYLMNDRPHLASCSLFGSTKPNAVERRILDAMTPGHELRRPTFWKAGVLLASPHSGNLYPSDFQDGSVLSLSHLRRNEDLFVDQLMGGCLDAGAPLLKALFPRCYVDVNRNPDELPPAWSDHPIKETPRAKAGIGVVPTHIGERMPIYRKNPKKADAQARLAELYHPYHAALSGLIEESKARFGQALLLDCHSMPGFAPMGSRRPDIVLGDRFGKACHSETLSTLRTLMQEAGFSVAVNYPYAGGYVTEHYGKPDEAVEVIQIEINRDLYVNPVTLKPKNGFQNIADRLSFVVRNMIDARMPDALAAQ